MPCPSPRVQCTAGEVTLTEIIAAINVIDCEQGGIIWEAAVEYKIGDSVWDNTVTPAAIYVCIIEHTSAVGDNVNGSPKQPSATNWTAYITHDPGII